MCEQSQIIVVPVERMQDAKIRKHTDVALYVGYISWLVNESSLKSLV